MLSSFTRSNLDVHGVISVVFSALCDKRFWKKYSLGMFDNIVK